MTFGGEYSSRVDSKGRIVFPTVFKKQFGSSTNGDIFILKEDLYEKCLVMYPLSEWERQNKLIRETLNPFDREHNQFLRMFSKGACEVTLDNVNRFLIPKRLLDYASIDKEVILSGQDSKIEIWSAETYTKMWDNPIDFGELAKRVIKP